MDFIWLPAASWPVTGKGPQSNYLVMVFSSKPWVWHCFYFRFGIFDESSLFYLEPCGDCLEGFCCRVPLLVLEASSVTGERGQPHFGVNESRGGGQDWRVQPAKGRTTGGADHIPHACWLQGVGGFDWLCAVNLTCVSPFPSIFRLSGFFGCCRGSSHRVRIEPLRKTMFSKFKFWTQIIICTMVWENSIMIRGLDSCWVLLNIIARRGCRSFPTFLNHFREVERKVTPFDNFFNPFHQTWHRISTRSKQWYYADRHQPLPDQITTTLSEKSDLLRSRSPSKL